MKTPVTVTDLIRMNALLNERTALLEEPEESRDLERLRALKFEIASLKVRGAATLLTEKSEGHPRPHIIMADPPWKYRDKKKSGRTKCGAENHYECMTDEEICALPVKEIAQPNCALFLWIPAPLLYGQEDPTESAPAKVMKAWGFKFRTVAFTWIKTNKDGTPWFGVGAYTKSNPEFCLLGVKGKVGRLCKDENGEQIFTDPVEKLSVASNSVSQLLFSPRRKHSQKPPEIYEKIETLFGDVKRAELFAREQVEGWDAVGFESGSFDTVESYAEFLKLLNDE